MLSLFLREDKHGIVPNSVRVNPNPAQPIAVAWALCMIRYAPTFIGEEFSKSTFQMARLCGSHCDITKHYG